jgi:hypothetical protein
MKGLVKFSLHIPIPVDSAEIGTITEYLLFSGSRASAGHLGYACYCAKPNSNCTLLWNLNSALITISTTKNPKNLFEVYLAATPTAESSISTCKSKILKTNFIYTAPRFKLRELDYYMTQAN